MATTDLPVTCIMPTRDRPLFVARAIAYFRRQDYPRRELIIVDDGDTPVADLAATDPHIRYVRLDYRVTIGAKRNLACEAASGDVILHWDDDDWMADWRISYQVTHLQRRQADICGVSEVFYYDLVSEQGWQYVYRQGGGQPWVAGNTMCYTRAFWQGNPFLNVSVGEDTQFLWSNRPKHMTVLPRSDFLIALIHGGNVEPKQPDDYWHPYPTTRLRRWMGDDWSSIALLPRKRHAGEHTQVQGAMVRQGHEHGRPAGARTTPIRNIFACLVHENPACVLDLVRNLRYLDPPSTILLYNGSNDSRLLERHFPYGRYDVVLHPQPRPMAWGRLHDFALDCMRFALEQLPFDTLTIVDSDQLAIRPGYTHYLTEFLAGQTGVGLLSNLPERQPPATHIPPAQIAFQEIDLWRPFLQRFSQSEQKFVHWSFWPSTVFTVDAARDLTKLFDTDAQLQEIMARTQIWATEEVILPTLVALLGYHIIANPCSEAYVKYRKSYTLEQVDAALANPNVYWMHPIARRYDERLRTHIRARFNHYEKVFRLGGTVPSEMSTAPALPLTLPILRLMDSIEGWLTEDEADLLIAVTWWALTMLPKPHQVVEIGSYCGRSTVVLGSIVKALCPEVKVYAIDPHDGQVGALDQGISVGSPTLEKFQRNINEAGLGDVIETIQQYSYDVHWEQPISLLMIDGLHDYANVSCDFFHFEPWIVDGGYIAFHDYADYYPGVKAFVHELLGSGQYRKVQCVGTMMVVQKQIVT